MLRVLLTTLCLGSALAAQRDELPPQPSFAFLQTPPPGLPPMPAPAGYTATEPMFELGRRLFADRILSSDRSISCSSCHPAATGFASREPLPAGVEGRRAKLHAPALWNRGYGTLQRWNGASPSLEAFVLEPIADANEMNLPLASALERLQADAGYRRLFADTFAAAPSAETLQRALATFVRGIVAGDAPYDRFVRGKVDAMTTPERTGQWIFESKGGCWQCHTPPLFTDDRFHNTGIGVRDGIAEAGRAAVTKDPADTGKWKTPTLRAVRFTAPYMHDGSLATLADVVAFYRDGGHANAQLDARVHTLDLSDEDQRALVAFLSSL
ncbi:MAG TPA: cytochrome c peroxidase [Planctomycetota bacterium]|nr:cytochrome c peroxidase [Planctomycetota bacterium]